MNQKKQLDKYEVFSFPDNVSLGIFEGMEEVNICIGHMRDEGVECSVRLVEQLDMSEGSMIMELETKQGQVMIAQPVSYDHTTNIGKAKLNGVIVKFTVNTDNANYNPFGYGYITEEKSHSQMVETAIEEVTRINTEEGHPHSSISNDEINEYILRSFGVDISTGEISDIRQAMKDEKEAERIEDLYLSPLPYHLIREELDGGAFDANNY